MIKSIIINLWKNIMSIRQNRYIDNQFSQNFSNLFVVSNQSELSQKEYQYLKKSQKIKTLCGEEFDLRFDEIKNSVVTTNGIKTLCTLWSLRKQYAKDNPHVKNQPGQEDAQQLQRQLKMYKPNFNIATKSDIRYTWIGHSTAVIQIGPDNILIDPVFAERSFFLQWAGPKRFRPPACQIAQLPKIDAVLISHDHYDHLDQHALNELYQRFDSHFIAGLNSQDVLPKSSKKILMDWMDTINLVLQGRLYKITFVPVCHWSRRWAFDFNYRLWGGFVIETPFNQKIFYSGDTGYCGVFKQIGDKYGPFDLTILPIGAYQPNQALKHHHINPNQAVLIHKELKSNLSLGVHWGTFPLGMEGYFQAKYDLVQARKIYGLRETQFLAICHGQSIVIQKQKQFKSK